MKNTYNELEDLLTDESFRSWVKNPTPELDQQWKTWSDVSKERAEMVNTARGIIQSLVFQEFHPNAESKERILQNIRNSTKPRARQISFFSTWYKAAAILIFAVSLGAIVYTNLRNKAADPIISATSVIKSNPSGVKSKLILSDGSTVFLNSGSSIEYPESFDNKVRQVKLKGEAYFEVSRDKARPFKVLMEDVEVVVLGTSFNVRSNGESPAVALVEGKVLLNAVNRQASLELRPGQMATFDKSRGSFSSSEFDLRYVTGWKDGYLMFRDANFDEVVDKLHNWYGVNVIVNNKSRSGDWSYTGNFKNQDLKSVLRNMSTLRKFDYQIKRDSLIISF